MSRAEIPVHVDRDTTLRVKIHDACGLTCTFCHNEGTPVAADNRDRGAGDFLATGPSGRMSIYALTNGAAFLPAPVPATDNFAHALTTLGAALELTELHLTGGEPTLHPAVATLTKIAVDAGFRVGMTSNGERGERVIPDCAAVGLDRVNFSIFGTTASELAEVQHTRFRNPSLAQRKIDALTRSISACETHGVKASANIVVPDHTHAPRVHRLLDEFSPNLTVRLLMSLDRGDTSRQAIERILADREAVAEAHYITAGGSNSRTAYRLPDGRRIFFKHIRPVRLPHTCAGCRFNNRTDCEEGFYGVRLYYDRTGTWQVGVCIQRMDLCLPLDEFLTSPLRAEVLALREHEYARLTTCRVGQPHANVNPQGAPVPIEHEAKVLDVDPATIECRILDKGGRKLGERLMRRHVYDITPGVEGKWIRLRDDGNRTTLAVKEITSDAIDGTHEVEVTVDDFATTNALLVMLGFSAKSYQETKRVSFTLDGAELELDTWPRIPPYLEIEAPTKADVIRVAELLGYHEADLTGENTIKIYARHGIDLNTIRELRF
ncbi:radical SAM protein [Nocardia higoensis]|uniref:radical SAM protein n=1 Tax=Nocardia higoensis TaxID=228599 RepID=UPI001E397303|nr:radical SAM protein [Nocardia higoensis]